VIRKSLGGGNKINDEFLVNAHKLNGQKRCPAVYDALETLLKGLEVKLPEGVSFRDRYGAVRYAARVQWWLDGPADLGDVALGPIEDRRQLQGTRLKEGDLPGYSNEHPVFFGHYWMTGTPARQTAKVACVDYSAANDGPLVAYRFEGERELSASSFVSSHP
jgi:hypothetical protein